MNLYLAAAAAAFFVFFPSPNLLTFQHIEPVLLRAIQAISVPLDVHKQALKLPALFAMTLVQSCGANLSMLVSFRLSRFKSRSHYSRNLDL